MNDIKTLINQVTGVSRGIPKWAAESFDAGIRSSVWKTKLDARNYDFTTVIDKFVIDTQEKMLTVMKESISSLIEDSNKTEAQGGKMRVDTGFLRASGVASLNSLPKGEDKGRKRLPGETGILPDYAKFGEEVGPTISKMKIGDTFYYGWTANYAKYREAYDGFLEVAVQKWQSFVDQAVQKVSRK